MLPTPAGLVCSYSGFVFPSNIVSSFDETPVMDDAGRKVKYSHIVIRIRGWITMDMVNDGSDTTDSFVERMRNVLGKSGAPLIYANKGVGVASVTVNAPGEPRRDVNMGPKPGPLRITLLGGAPLGNLACGFEWQVECWLPECTSAMYVPGAGVFTQFNFAIHTSIDDCGYAVVRTVGSFEIPLSLQTDTTIADTADSNWETVLGPQMLGFKRETQRELTADRRRINFTTTETQLPGQALPRNVVRAEIEQRVHNPKSGNLVAWTGTISGTVHCNARVYKSAAWNEVFGLVAERLAITRQTRAVAGNPDQPAPFGGPIGQFFGDIGAFLRGGVFNAAPGNAAPAANAFCVILIQSFDMSDAWFADTFRFSLTYRITGSSLSTILAASGMWRGLGTSWTDWHVSLRLGAQAPRGLRGWAFNAQNDVIVDVCHPIGAALGAQNAIDNPMVPVDDNNVMASATEAQTGVVFAPPDNGATGILAGLDPESTWMEYENDIKYFEDGHQVRHKPLAGDVTPVPVTIDPLGPAANLAADTAAPTAGATVTVSDIIQQNRSPSAALVLDGGGVRLGYKVNVPRLISYGGIPLGLPATSSIQQKTIGEIAGVPIYATVWRLVYLLPQPPAALPTASNPFLGVDGA